VFATPLLGVPNDRGTGCGNGNSGSGGGPES
jgi:hypothetical protein